MQIIEAKTRLKIPQVWIQLRLPGKASKSCCCPWRRDKHPSFSVFADGTRWKDHATGERGDAVDFFEQATGLSHYDACRQFIAMASGSPPGLPLRPKTHDQPVAPMAIPALSQGTWREWTNLACARSVSVEAVKLAVQRGLLRFGWFRHRPAWFVTDSSRQTVQARRMDRMRWWPSGPKALTLAGSQGSWPIGASEVDSFPLILLTEGGPDLLAAFHFILLAERASTITAAAMLGAGNSIHPEALLLFAGKRVRIIPHLDNPDKKGRRVGIDAACRWQEQLKCGGAKVEIVNLHSLVSTAGNLKDLNDATRLPIGRQMTLTTWFAGL